MVCSTSGLGDGSKSDFDNVRIMLKPAVAASKAIPTPITPFGTPVFCLISGTLLMIDGVEMGTGVTFLCKFFDFKPDKLIVGTD